MLNMLINHSGYGNLICKDKIYNLPQDHLLLLLFNPKFLLVLLVLGLTENETDEKSSLQITKIISYT